MLPLRGCPRALDKFFQRPQQVRLRTSLVLRLTVNLGALRPDEEGENIASLNFINIIEDEGLVYYGFQHGVEGLFSFFFEVFLAHFGFFPVTFEAFAGSEVFQGMHFLF